MKCASCGSDAPGGAKFCSTCGASLSKSDEERRIVTVLFADIVGFTRLAEVLDPEEVKHRVDACFERLTADIASFGGVVDKILGDAIVALFGAPVAHEDDAERAVRAGLRMQQTLAAMGSDLAAPFRMRVGINTGEVLVGSSSAGDYTAMGDVVNSASRLQSAASPGLVLVGEATQAATREAISYQQVGALDVRGREEALTAWVALSAVRPPGVRTRRIAAFVGRTRELELLHAQARLAVELGQAQIATVYGEAGAGKTRLVEEAAGQLASRFEARVLEGRCVPYGEANVWWPIADVLRHAFGLAHDSPEEEAKAVVEAGLRTQLGAEGAEELPRFCTALMHALGFLTPLRGGDRTRNRAEVTLAMSRFLEVELRHRPVVIVLSDVHWAAEAVWELVRHLLESMPRSRLMVLVTARRSETSELIEGRFGSLTMELGPLDSDASRLLVSELGVDLNDGETEDLIARSGGNPFFLEELAGLVGNSTSLAARSDRDSGRLDQLPDNLRGILAARLDRLDPPARRLIESAAVLGRAGSVEGLATMNEAAGLETDISEELSALEAADLLSVSGDRYEFMSDLIREVAYATITKTNRAQLHAGIARFRERTESGPIRNSRAVAIATHYLAAAELLRDLTEVDGVDGAEVTSKALHWSLQAGWRALGAGVPKDAIRWFADGLNLSGDDATRALFLYGRAKALCEVRDFGGTRADLEALEPLAQHDPVLAAKALVVSGDIDQKAGYLDRAAAQLREAADRLDELGELSERSLALRLLGMTELYRGEETMARRALNTSREVAAAAEDRRQEAWAIQSLAEFAFRTGRVAEARANVAEAEEIFTELDDRGGLAWTRGVSAWVAFHEGDWDRARQLAAEVLPETRRRGDPWAEAVMLGLESSMALWSGEAGRALELSQETQSIAERADDLALSVQARALEGRALLSLGRIPEGLVALEQSFALAERAGDEESRRLAVISNCAASARLGEAERAIRWAARFEGVHGDPSIVGESDLSVSLALALLQRGAVDEAASQLSWMGSFESGPPNSYAAAVGAIVAAAQNDADSARSKARGVLDGRGTYLDRTLAHLALAAVASSDGQSEQIDVHLADAREELATTDDRVSPLLVDMVAAICGRASLDEVEDALRGRSIDPAGWRMAWTLAATPGTVRT